MDKIEDIIAEMVKEKVSEQMRAVRYNLDSVIGGLLYSLKLEIEKEEGTLSGIHELINHVINTSHYTGPEHEEYPVWDKKNKDIQKIINRLEKHLLKHNIEQSWNIGRTTINNMIKDGTYEKVVK